MFVVSDLMTKKVFTLRRQDTLRDARSLMQLVRIRHIPIVDEDNTFRGLLTHRDILAATVSRLADVDDDLQSELDAGIPIKEIMQTDVLTVSGGTPLRQAAQLLLDHKYGCLPVLDDKNLVGIITEADFLRLTISLLDNLEYRS